MITRSSDPGLAEELLQKAQLAFPWYDAARLSYFIDAVQETAYRANRIVGARHPAQMLDPAAEQALASVIFETVAARVQAMSGQEGPLVPRPR